VDRSVAYNQRALDAALQARSLTHGQLSRRLDIDSSQLERELQRKPEPRQGLLNRIAGELALPVFTFFMDQAPRVDDPLPDYRSEQPKHTAKEKETIKAIQLAHAVQRMAAEVGAPSVAGLPAPSQISALSSESFANRTRSYFDISVKDQSSAKTVGAFYTLCRRKIESKRIFVLHDSFPSSDGSGFCLADRKYPVILINTKDQTRGRRLFTLIHELAHVIIGRSGISDPFVQKNSIERHCNKFAGNFLVPRESVTALLGSGGIDPNPDQDSVKWASRRLKISQEATVLRLEQLGVYTEGTYEKWKRLVHNRNPDYSEKGGGAAPPPQEKVKLAKFGFNFANSFAEPLNDGRLSDINLFRATGLKPQYRKPYFDYAAAVGSDDTQELELDDE
jgi:Zn-dependent peptidase ImmA (M78 family)/transcriptional regulator with XRE-family HTH domain